MEGQGFGDTSQGKNLKRISNLGSFLPNLRWQQAGTSAPSKHRVSHMTASPQKRRKWKSRQSRYFVTATLPNELYQRLLEFSEQKGVTIEESLTHISRWFFSRRN